jgi:hypothetical protein
MRASATNTVKCWYYLNTFNQLHRRAGDTPSSLFKGKICRKAWKIRTQKDFDKMVKEAQEMGAPEDEIEDAIEYWNENSL